MFDKWKNFSIGIIATIAIALVVWVMLFLHPTFGDGGKLIRVRFSNVEKIGIGTRVTYAGKAVGEVIAFNMVPEARTATSNSLDPLFIYELTLSIDSHIIVYTSDDIRIQTAGLMGEKNIAITPKRSQDGSMVLLQNNELTYATTSDSVEDTFKGLNNVSRKAEKTLDELISLLDKNQANFQKTMEAIEQSSAQLQTFVKRSNELDLPGALATTLTTANQMCEALTTTIGKVEEGKIVENLAITAANFKNLSEAADSNAIKEIITQAKQSVDNLAILTIEIHDSWGHVDEAAQSLAKTMKQGDALIASIAQGKGSLGKLINSDDFYLKAQGILAKVDTSISDVNNYGMLFHLDKSWQRERRKRILELEQLQTASQFKSFLDRELSQISTSVSRVGIALDKADTALAVTDNMPNKAIAKREFMRSYNELLGQLHQLENTLKTYGGEHIAESDSVLLDP